MYQLSDSEHAAVLQLNPDYRRAHFLTKFREFKELYFLCDSEGPFLLQDSEADEDGNTSTLLPVWCHPRYAEDFAASQELSGFKPQSVSAAAFAASWIPFLEENKFLVALMPLADCDFAVLEPAEVK